MARYYMYTNGLHMLGKVAQHVAERLGVLCTVGEWTTDAPVSAVRDFSPPTKEQKMTRL